MSMSIFGQFHLHQVGTEAPAQRDLGIATLLAAVVAAGEATALSIVDARVGWPLATAPDAGLPGDDQWSLWVFAHNRWRFCVVGATSLDELAADLVSILAQGDHPGRELRICPPGAPHPGPIC